MAWKAGYTLYAPNKIYLWHKWGRVDRPLFGNDANESKYTKRINTLAWNHKLHAIQIRNTILRDKEYRHYLDEKWGIDLLGKQGTKKIVNSGLDPYYFMDKEMVFDQKLKIVE